MRQAIINLINVNRWSISTRILIGMMLMIIIPTVVAFVLVEREVRSVDFENLQAYLQERGTQQRDILTDNFSRIRLETRTFAETDTQRGFMLRLLAFGSTVPEVLNSLENYMNDRMVGIGLFDGVRLLDVNGIVQLSSGIVVLGDTVRIAEIGDDESDSPAFRAFRTASELGETQRWALNVDAESGDIRIEAVYVVRNADGEVGYIVGSVNSAATVFDVLARSDVFVQTDSYLVTTNRNLLAPEDYVLQAQQSVLNAPIEPALAQRSGIDRYFVGDTEYIAYYAPILDTPFALITETPVAVNFVATLGRVYNSGFLIIIGLTIVGAVLGALLTQTITPPLQSLQDDMVAMSEGNFDKIVVTANRADEIGVLGRSFIALREQVRSVLEEQTDRIAARVRDLQATQEVSRFAANQRDLQSLMNDVVELIVQSFPNIYHAQIFLIDEDRRYAVLRASTGTAGRQLLDRGHRLGVGSVSVIGQVTEEARIVVARDTVDSAVHRSNEFLPDTRAELAVPLTIGDRIIGALDVQSRQSGSFNEDQVSILQTMADQIAIAIENTRLYQESMQRLEEIEVLNRASTRFAWQEYLNEQRQRDIASEAGTYHFTTQESPIRQQAIKQRSPAIGEVTNRNTVPFAVPIMLRGQVLGAAEWELPQAEFDREKVQLAQELVNRLALSLDNARLFQTSQRATSRERLVNEISAKLTGQTDIEAILQTAVREVGQALRSPKVQINLSLTQPGKDNGHTE